MCTILLSFIGSLYFLSLYLYLRRTTIKLYDEPSKLIKDAELRSRQRNAYINRLKNKQYVQRALRNMKYPTGKW